ncbi:MAG TPA: hypothetical protein VHN14_37030 [Kofleriaceae bacterium]|jgi:hypothetical protein|nr:hypothetical protein [Kofleriaceae bacterium]
MRIALLAGLSALAALAAATPARGDALRRTVMPMTRADGDVCDLLRAQINDKCKRLAQDGGATVYQSGSKAGSKAAGIRRLVLAIDTGSDVLVGPAVDLLAEELESSRPTLRTMAIDGRPGVVLDVVSTWKRGKTAEHAESLVGCMQADGIWKCSLVDVGPCDASVGLDGSVTTSCGTTSTLSIAPSKA